jgi:hypothetical protein
MRAVVVVVVVAVVAVVIVVVAVRAVVVAVVAAVVVVMVVAMRAVVAVMRAVVVNVAAHEHVGGNAALDRATKAGHAAENRHVEKVKECLGKEGQAKDFLRVVPERDARQTRRHDTRAAVALAAAAALQQGATPLHRHRRWY